MQQFIDPLTLARVKDMPLVARTVAQGVLHGQHASQRRGAGIEFSQYRVYEPGDDLAKLDWKLFARSDRYFVREAERESNINVWLVIDASASMAQISEASAAQGGWNKFDYGRYLLATIGFLAQQQGDAVGLLGLSTDAPSYLPAMAGEKHWQGLMLALARMRSGGRFPAPAMVQAQLGRMRHHGLVILVSDFYQQDNEVVDFASQLTGPNTDVVGITLGCEDETTFPYTGALRFEDRETGQQVLVSGDEARATYLENRGVFQQQLSVQLQRLQIQQVLTDIEQPLDQVLHAFLRARQQVN